MTLPIKKYVNSIASNWYRQCQFITRHKAVMITVVTTLSPSNLAAFTAGLTAAAAFCDLLQTIMKDVDPNWKPE